MCALSIFLTQMDPPKTIRMLFHTIRHTRRAAGKYRGTNQPSSSSHHDAAYHPEKESVQDTHLEGLQEEVIGEKMPGHGNYYGVDRNWIYFCHRCAHSKFAARLC